MKLVGSIRSIIKGVILTVILATGYMCTYETDVIPTRPPQQYDYIFLGHTYEWGQPNDRPQVDPRVEELDFRKYDGIWLGGDIVHTLSQQHTLNYLDGLFDLNSEDTHWSVGNHDIRDGGLALIRSKTNRNHFYAQTKNDVTILVLNTPMLGSQYGQDCVSNEEQLALINNVLDTLSVSKHLVILTHYAVWGDLETGTMNIGGIANSDQRWQDFVCNERARFQDVIYPKLVRVKNLGINVFVISGDGGQKNKGHSYISQEGVQFLISGINNSVTDEVAANLDFNTAPDSVLIFHQDVSAGSLDFEFVELNGL